MTARLIRWFFISLVLVLTSAHASASDLVTDRAFFEDQRGDMTFEQVKQAQFSKTDKVLSKGYLRGALWVRLTVDAPDEARPLVLQLFPAVLDEVTIFSINQPNAGPAAGARLGRRLLGHRTLIDATSGVNSYYLRVKTPGLMLVSANILTEDQAHQEDIKRGIVLGAVLACCIPIMIGMFILIVKRREPLHILFLLNFSVSVAVYFGWFGYLREFFDPQGWFGSSAFITFLGVINIFTGFLFVRALLERFGLPRWGKYLFNLFFVLYVPLFLFFFLLDRQLVLNFSTSLGLGASVFCLILTVAVFRRQKSATWLIATILFLALLLLLRSLLMVRGIVAPDGSTLYLLAFRIFFFAVFFLSIIFLIDREKQSLIQTSILNETVARSQAESEKNRREIQERFMTMLMHELKTPLAIIQLAATSLGRHLLPNSGDATRVTNINRSVDDLNALIERCAQADQIEQGVDLIHEQLFAVTTLTDDLLQTVDASRIRLVGTQAQTVFSDYQYVRLILRNLLSNALKYSPADSMIELQIESTSVNNVACVSFRVVNTVGAAGMPDPAQVFSRYYRSEAARQHVGAGLGLWLAQAVARQLGSEVHFQAPHGQVEFSFCLAQA
jgi:signal transduction histidine kinase